MRPLTNSELVAFRRCRRKWWLGYFRGLKLRQQPVDPKAVRTVGTKFHDVVKVYYRAVQKGGEPPRSYEDFRGLGCDDLVATMASGYVEWLETSGVDQGLQVVDVERVLEVALPGTELLVRSKVDLRFLQDGRYGVGDHKTVSSLGDYDKIAGMLTQPLHYLLVERLSGAASVEWAGKFFYGLARRVKRTIRANPPFFDRKDVYKTARQVDIYEKQLYAQVEDMVRLEEELRASEGAEHLVAYPTPEKDCSYSCDFFAVCPLFNESRRDAEAVVKLGYEEGDPLAHHLEEEA